MELEADFDEIFVEGVHASTQPTEGAVPLFRVDVECITKQECLVVPHFPHRLQCISGHSLVNWVSAKMGKEPELQTEGTNTR